MNLCSFIGHSRETVLLVDDDRKYVVFEQSDCLRCGEPSTREPMILEAKRDPKQSFRSLPCPICNSPTQLVGTDCYPDEGVSVECCNVNCDYELTVTAHGSVRTSNSFSLKPAAIVAHNTLWSNKNVR